MKLLIKDSVANNLSVLFNLSCSSGIFPDKLKIGKILPVFRKELKLECSNYRPILLLSNLDKIIEKLMHERLVEFLNKQKILYCKYCGFCKGFSTVHTIINLIDNIESAIYNKLFVSEFFIDMQKIFHIQLITTFYLKKYNTIVSEEYLINGLNLI